MAGFWSVRQCGDVVHRFRDRECDAEVWAEILVSFAILMEKGPSGSGHRIAKKLKAAGGIWELLAHVGNRQPRLLFYEHDATTLVFVHAFMKKGKQDYGQAINLAKQRRSEVKGGRRGVSVIDVHSRVH